MVSASDGGVVVSSDQIYKQLQEVSAAVSRLEGKLDTLSDHEKRIRALEEKERKTWQMPVVATGGLAAAIAAVYQALYPGQ